MNILIYGTGSCADKFLENLDGDVNVLAFIDSDINKAGDIKNQKQIISINDINKYNYDYIIIASSYIEEIKLNLIKNNIIEEKIICYMLSNELGNKFTNLYNRKTEVLNKIISKNDPNNKIFTQNLNSYDLNYDDIEFEKVQKDFSRVMFVISAKNIIEEYKVEGAVAEFGVFKGEFAEIINKYFSDRNLYLFDTFESFNKEELKKEVEKGFVSKYEADNLDRVFSKTNIDIVMNRMEYKEKVKIFKGFFPQTAKNIDERFAFVSIDCDFYESMLEGLRYFYPRLNEGGYILLHDYNNKYIRGVKPAVREYEKELGINLNKFQLSDKCGTLVITK